ncbi:F-box protein CPR30-like [Gossypium australe]|uniref:F-box protein CPR30-like n=1 Tax=Gossypium australe TaxID=47621 RepID=A0A5B6WBX3_9ROSI|nr:F-box protein CPR30-like [Gossypium australe]
MHLNCYGRNTDGFFVYGCYSYGIQHSKSLFDQPRKFIIGSIDGLVCLRCFLKKDDRLRIHICNPSTREIMEPPQCHHNRNDLFVATGFGFCHKSNDYKVVQISYRRDSPSSKVQVQVYSLNMNSWKTIKMENPSLWALSP